MSTIVRVPLDDLPPVKLRYTGLFADQHAMDMGELGESMSGLSRIISALTGMALNSELKVHRDAVVVRVRVQAFEPGSFELKAIIEFVGQAYIQTDGFKIVLATLMDWFFATMGKPKGESEVESLREALARSQDLNEKAVDEMAALAHKSLDLLASASKQAVRPIGDSCEKVAVEIDGIATVQWDEKNKQAIMDRLPKQLLDPATYEVLITELDIVSRTAKLKINDLDHRRIRAKIADPAIEDAGNPYTQALDSQSKIRVVAKAEVVDGEITSLHISHSL